MIERARTVEEHLLSVRAERDAAIARAEAAEARALRAEARFDYLTCAPVPRAPTTREERDGLRRSIWAKESFPVSLVLRTLEELDATEGRALLAEAACVEYQQIIEAQPLHPDPAVDAQARADREAGRTVDRAAGLDRGWHKPGAPLLDALRLCAEALEKWPPCECGDTVAAARRDTALAAIRKVLGGAP